jgi:Fe-S oxidoreductase
MATEVSSGRILSIGMGDFVGMCHADEAPPCGHTCPLGLDVIGFISKLRRGNFDGAYKIFSECAIFPEIVCRICDAPCEKACLRSGIDGAISLRKLEQAVVAHARQTNPVRYAVKKKNRSVAIIGAGIGGLSCAVTLSAFGYDVIVYDSHSAYGHDLAGLLPEAEYTAMIERRLASTDIAFRMGVASPAARDDEDEKIRSFDAELKAPSGTENPVAAIKKGIALALRTDAGLKTGGAGEDAEPRGYANCANIFSGYADVKPGPRVIGDLFTKEEAIEEASVCMQCKCDFCRRGCDFMKHYDVLPKKIARDVKVTFNPVEGLQRRIATRMINSCYDCGRCKDLCDEGIDVGKFLLEARSIMQREGVLPPAFHEFWVRDMEHAMGESAFFARNAPGKAGSKYVFFPGCRLGASEPFYVEASYRYLARRLDDVGILVSCCGVPAVWAGKTADANAVTERIRSEWERMGRPTLICACLTCIKTLNAYFPEAETVSLYTVIEKNGLPDAERTPFEVEVFDPCSLPADSETADSVRTLLKACGVKTAERGEDRFAAACCGFGGHIYAANRNLYEKIVNNRTAASELPYVTYCVNCNDIFSKSGKESRHILDIVFPSGRTREKTPTCSDYRRNREALKTGMLKVFWNEEAAEAPFMGKYALEIDDALREKMDADQILTDDVLTTVAFCESECCGLLDPETGVITGHLKIGVVTYWVQYKIKKSVCHLINAYSHRLTIEGEGSEGGTG